MKRVDPGLLSRRQWLGVLGALPAACVPSALRPPRCYVGSAGDPSCRELLWSYNSMDHSRSTVLRPLDLADLRRTLMEFPLRGRRLTFRGGGASLDRQSLNDDTVILLDNPSFATVNIDLDDPCGPTLTVGAGATWQQVLDHTLPLGLVPYCTPSASFVRIGGGLAANSFSRMSARWGREERYLRQFTLVGPDGRIYDCHPGQSPASLEYKLFHAVPGAQGYLGVVTRARYALRRIAPAGSPLCVRTETRVQTLGRGVQGNETGRNYLRDLRFESKHLPPDAPLGCPPVPEDDGNPETPDGIFGTLWWARDVCRTMRGLIGRTKYLPESHVGKPRGLLNRRDSFLRVFGEYGFVEPGGEASFQDINYHLSNCQALSYDPVDDFAFFQDADARAKRYAEPRWRMTAAEQAYCIHPDRAGEFLEALDYEVRLVEHYPALVDLLYAPRDLRHHPLSATSDDRTMVFTVAYLDRNGERWACSQAMYRTLAAHCARLGGKVYLGKTVEAEVADLDAMWCAGVHELRALKRQVDRHGLIANEFWDRNLGCLTPLGAL